MRLLITGFGAFDGGSNASEALLGAVAGRRGELERVIGGAVETEVLPVDTEVAPARLSEALRRFEPSHVLLTGQAAGRARVTLERFAVNLRDFRVPDQGGHIATGEPVAPDGPAAYAATWPDLAGAAAAIEACGVPAAVSNHAGTHLCNQMLYHVLHGDGAAPPVATFLHLPITPEQMIRGEPAARRHADCPYLPTTMALAAVAGLLHHLVRTSPK
jgi:pyroglutamyl-peptidase